MEPRFSSVVRSRRFAMKSGTLAMDDLFSSVLRGSDLATFIFLKIFRIYRRYEFDIIASDRICAFFNWFFHSEIQSDTTSVTNKSSTSFSGISAAAFKSFYKSSMSGLATSVASTLDIKSSAILAWASESIFAACTEDCMLSYIRLCTSPENMSSFIASSSIILSDISWMMVLQILTAYCFLICSVNESCRKLPPMVFRFSPISSSTIV